MSDDEFMTEMVLRLAKCVDKLYDRVIALENIISEDYESQLKDDREERINSLAADMTEAAFKKEIFKRIVEKSGIANDKYVLRDYAAYVSRYSELPLDEYTALLKESYPRYAQAVDIDYHNETGLNPPPKPHRCSGGCVGRTRGGSYHSKPGANG